MESDIVSGRQAVWALTEKLGEGDAGEVYRVESLLDGRRAILKRPHRTAFTGDVLRQSGQIRTEGKVLETLRAQFEALEDGCMAVPRVIDESKPGSEYTGGLFLIIEEAQGLDLGLLMRACRFGLENQGDFQRVADVGEARFLEVIASQGRIPERILLLAMRTLLELFDQIHAHPFHIEDADYAGLIWNDVKPDHIFWDPRRDVFTIIDWGNCQFLDEDGASRDRRYSRLDDIRQFFEEMGRYLANAAPELYQALGLPTLFTPGAFSDSTLADLRVRVNRLLALENDVLETARTHERTLLEAGARDNADLLELGEVHTLILTRGAVPDYSGASHFAAGLAVQIAQQTGRLPELDELCRWASALPGSRAEAWGLVARLAPLAAAAPEKTRPIFLDALQAAISADGQTILWDLALALQDQPEPLWWYDLSADIRRLVFGVDGEGLRPLVAVNRLMMGLQSAMRRLEDTQRGSTDVPDPTLGLLQDAVRRLREEILPGWTQIEPAPPYSGLAYADLEEVVASLADLPSNDVQTVRLVMSQPHNEARGVLDAWEKQDFGQARKGLARMLAWDPERRRVLRSDLALQRAPDWLRIVRLGPAEGTGLLQFVTQMEFSGRELRNQVGPAAWLDRALDGLRRLRRGVWPGDLLSSRPGILADLPWLVFYERSEKIESMHLPAQEEGQTTPLEDGEPGQTAEKPAPPFTWTGLKGMKPSDLGPGKDISLLEPMDAWAPEARGSSARVYLGCLRNPDGNGAPAYEAAVKLMRMDKIDYALPLFREEVLVLDRMKDVPGVNRLVECGFLELGGEVLPVDDDLKAIQALAGQAVRIGVDAGQIFLNLLESRVKDGWTPYVAIETRRQQDNLMTLCDAGHTQGHFLPVADLVQMAIQICEILEIAHQRNIVYRDHKILHYYWQESTRGIYLIDWNVARYNPQGLSEVDRHMDLVQFAARGMHHILTGRVAPGALPLGPTRPEEIETAADSYKAQWTYDDQRLSDELRDLIERSLAGEYVTARDICADLKKAYMRLAG